MAGLGSLFGIGNASGGQFQATSANIAQPVTAGQAAGSLQSQQNLVNALQAQNGLGAQASALNQQQALAGQLAGQNGIGNQSSVFNQQQALSNQLGNIAAGQGPNPAQSMLNQSTGQNVQNQAALMAGQRGAGANAGLIARQVAQQGAATQQQAVGQGATLQAQQSLAALQQQAAQQQAMGQLASQQVGQQVGQAQNVAGQANILGGQQIGAQQQLTGNTLGQLGSQNQLNVANQANLNTTNAAIQGINTKGQQGLASGALSGLGSAAVSLLAEGGEVGSQNANLKENYGPKSKAGKHLHQYAHGGKVHRKVPAMVSPGEVVLSPEQAKKAKAGKGSPLAGKKVPGHPQVGGAVNSYANDTVPMTLREGGVVLPRTVTQSSNPKESAAKFIAALKAKKGK